MRVKSINQEQSNQVHSLSRRRSSNLLPDIAESSARAADCKDSKKSNKDKTMKELKVNVSLLANDDGIGSLPHTPTNSNGPQVSSRSHQVLADT